MFEKCQIVRFYIILLTDCKNTASGGATENRNSNIIVIRRQNNMTDKQKADEE